MTGVGWFWPNWCGRKGASVYLRAWDDYERHSLKLTAAKQPGLGHMALRARSPQALQRRVDALVGFLTSEDGTSLLTAYRRASNIVAIEERRDNRRYDADIDRALLKQPEEFALAGDLDLARGGVERSLHREEFEAAMAQVAALRRPVDEFFERVTVNTDEPRLRENRLRLLAGIRTTMNQVADFSQIEG